MKHALSTVAFIAFAFLAFAATGSVSEKDVIGRWYRGDHLGYNVVLIISPDHTYKADWSGDEIDTRTGDSSYGKATGKWRLENDQLVIKPFKETKDTKGDLETMRIVRRHGKIYLAPIRSLKVPTVFHLDPMMVFEHETR